MDSRGQIALATITILSIGLLDAILKHTALLRAPLAQITKLKPIIDFALHKNPGIAFDIPVPFLIILPLTVIICLIFGYFAVIGIASLHGAAVPTAVTVSSIMVIVGALGNLADRAVNGFTTDYLILFRTSAINLSDVLILLGMLNFLWYHRRHPQPETT